MSEEPAEPRKGRGQTLIDLGREDLELFGTDELEDRIVALEVEVERTRAQLNRKSSSRAAADALFSKRD
jgi:uncharacterized small protein (DUF1192 family)